MYFNFDSEVLGRGGRQQFLNKCVACALYLIQRITNTFYFCEPCLLVSVVDFVSFRDDH